MESETPYIQDFDNEIDAVTKDDAAAARLKAAGRKLLEEAAVDMSLIAAEAIGLTLLTIHRDGRYGGRMQSPSLNRVAEILTGANSGQVDSQTH